MEEWTRRTFIQQTLGAGGALALGLSCARPESDADPFTGGECWRIWASSTARSLCNWAMDSTRGCTPI